MAGTASGAATGATGAMGATSGPMAGAEARRTGFQAPGPPHHR
jgi:hypothetical protein